MSKRFIAFIMRNYLPPSDQLVGFLITLITLLGPIVVLALTSLSPLSILMIIIVIAVLSPYFYRKFIVRRELLLNFTDHISMFDKLDFRSQSSDITPSIERHITDITICYENTPVSKLHTVLLKVENIGNTRIQKRDFQKIPLVVTLSNTISLINVEIKAKYPDDITVTLDRRQEHKVIIQPFSLSVGAWFHIRFTFDFASSEFMNDLITIEPSLDGDGEFDITIYKKNDWEEKSEKRRRRRYTFIVSALALLSLLAVCLGMYVWLFSQDTDFATLPYQLLAAFIIACLYFGVVCSIIINRVPSTTAP